MLTSNIQKLLLTALCTTSLSVSAQALPTSSPLVAQQLVGRYAIHLDKSTATHLSEQTTFKCEPITQTLAKAFQQCRLDELDIYLCNLTVRPAAPASGESDPDFIVLKTLNDCESVLDVLTH